MFAVRRLLGCALVAVSANAWAEANFQPQIDLGLVHTDNLALSYTDPEAQTVWRLTPGFTYQQQSKRLVTAVAYQMQAYHYVERDQNETFNQFDGKVAVGLVPDRFFLNISATRDQAIVDPESTIPLNTLVVNANRVDVDSVTAGPSIRVPVGQNTMISADVTRTHVNYDDKAIGYNDYDYDTQVFSIDNYAQGHGMTWAVRYNHDKADYGDAFYEYQRAGIELGFWAGRRGRVFASGGKESPWDNPVNRGLEDPYWEVGFSRDLTSRMHLELAGGERSFGSSARGSLSVEFGHGASILSYEETPTTNSFDRFSKGALNPDDPNDYLFRAGAIERYIANRAAWLLRLNLSRTIVSVNLFDEARTDRTQVNGTPLPNEYQSGGRISATWKMGRFTDLVLSGLDAHSSFADGTISDITTATVAARHKLGSLTLLVLQYDRVNERFQPNTTFGYRSNMFSVSVSRIF